MQWSTQDIKRIAEINTPDQLQHVYNIHTQSVTFWSLINEDFSLENANAKNAALLTMISLTILKSVDLNVYKKKSYNKYILHILNIKYSFGTVSPTGKFTQL